MPNHSGQQTQLSWLQSSSGEWRYFLDENITNEDNKLALEQDYIWLVSQASATHKVSGYRIANQTIERFIKQLAGVNQSIVFGVPHEQKGNALHVYVELTDPAIERTALTKAINAKLTDYFGDFARAEVIKYVDKLPIVKNQEITRKILKSQNITMNCAA